MRWQARLIRIGILLNFVVYFVAATCFWRIHQQRYIDEVAKFAMVISYNFKMDAVAERVMARTVFNERVFQKNDAIPYTSPHSFVKIISIQYFQDRSTPAPVYSISEILDIPSDVLEFERNISYFRFNSHKNLLLTSTLNEMEYLMSPYLPRNLPGVSALTFEVQFKSLLELLSKRQIGFTLAEFDQDFNYDIIYTDLQKEDEDAFVKSTSYLNDESVRQIRDAYKAKTGYKNAIITTLSNTKHLVLPMIQDSHPKIRQSIFYTVALPDYRSIDRNSIFLFAMALFITTLGCFILGLLKTIQ